MRVLGRIYAQGSGRPRRTGTSCSCVRNAPRRRAEGKAAGKRGKAKAKVPKAGLHLPGGLEQRHLDLIGLALVAFGVYLVFVLFLGWEGGKVGYGVETGLIYLFGSVGARIFTILLLTVGGMLLTGTSVSSLARGVGRGVRGTTKAVFHGGDAAARTVARSHADWREQRDARTAETKAGVTDVMSSYPEEDDDFEPTIALAEEEDDFDTSRLRRPDPGRAEGDEETVVEEADEFPVADHPVEAVDPPTPAPDQRRLTPRATCAASPPPRRSTTGRRRRRRWSAAKATRAPIRATRN